MRLPPLPGQVPSAMGNRQAVLSVTTRVGPSGEGSVDPMVNGQPSASGFRAPKDHIRSDFAKELETRLTGWVGRPGTEQFEQLEKIVGPYLKPTDEVKPDGTGKAVPSTVDLEKLPESSKRELVKLQHAAEGIESIFVKKLLSQMRSISFDKEKSGPMADFAKDMMDQAVAEQAAKGHSSVGIARMVFLDTAQTLVRTAIAQKHDNEQGH